MTIETKWNRPNTRNNFTNIRTFETKFTMSSYVLHLSEELQCYNRSFQARYDILCFEIMFWKDKTILSVRNKLWQQSVFCYIKNNVKLFGEKITISFENAYVKSWNPSCILRKKNCNTNNYYVTVAQNDINMQARSANTFEYITKSVAFCM